MALDDSPLISGFSVTAPGPRGTRSEPYVSGHALDIAGGVLTVLDSEGQPVKIYGSNGWLHVTFGVQESW